MGFFYSFVLEKWTIISIITIISLYRSLEDDKTSAENSGSNYVNPDIVHCHHLVVLFMEEKVQPYR